MGSPGGVLAPGPAWPGAGDVRRSGRAEAQGHADGRLEAWTATVRLQRQPGYEAMIERMQRRERGVPVDLDELLRPRG
jgi:hypothetical protein